MVMQPSQKSVKMTPAVTPLTYYQDLPPLTMFHSTAGILQPNSDFAQSLKPSRRDFIFPYLLSDTKVTLHPTLDMMSPGVLPTRGHYLSCFRHWTWFLSLM